MSKKLLLRQFLRFYQPTNSRRDRELQHASVYFGSLEAIKMGRMFTGRHHEIVLDRIESLETCYAELRERLRKCINRLQRPRVRHIWPETRIVFAPAFENAAQIAAGFMIISICCDPLS